MAQRAQERDRRPRVAITHPRLGEGGSEARSLWAVEALKDRCRVTLVSGGPVNLDALNRACGTAVAPGDAAILRVPVPAWLGERAAALRGAWFQRACRRLAPRFDAMISAYNPCDFGVPAIHCLADFSWDETLRRTLHPESPDFGRAAREHPLGRRLYAALARAAARPSGRPLPGPGDLVLANSRWSAERLRERFGIESPVLYPPVPDPGPGRPWAEREDGVLCLGRVAPEKRIEEVVAVVRALRALGHGLRLGVIGGAGPGAYGRRIRALCEAERDWARLEGRQVGAAKAALLGANRFGLHACRGEAFGIAVAEMVKAGLVVLAPAQGGPAEILAHPALLFADPDDAVAKFDALLRDPGRLAEARAHLARQGRLFSAERYVAGLRAAVDAFLARRARERGAP